MPKLPRDKTEILRAAIRLHAAGWWVVPQAGKQAVVLGWPQIRLSESDLEEYLSDGKLNIAIVLSQSAVMDVECDSEEAEAELLRLCGTIPRTPTWKSRRGLHRLFLRPDGLPQKSKLEINGIEFRLGVNPALSTVPPSIHPDDGTVYRWLPMRGPDVPPAELPKPLLDLLLSHKGSRKKARDEEASVEEIGEGRRNDELFRLGSRAARAMPLEEVESYLHGKNAKCCKPPLPDAEVEGIVKSIRELHERSKTDICSLRCDDWNSLVSAWEEALEWRKGIEEVFAVMLAVAASTIQMGNQLFMQVVGEPGSAKTRLCEAMLVSKQCKRLERINGVFSGTMDYEDKSKDFSFLSRSNGLCWITPEADLLASSPGFSEMMSQMRRVFDGSASVSYKNRDHEMEYSALRTPWIMAGTPAMLDRRQSSLGDRFLRIYMDQPTEEVKRRILKKVGLTELDAVLMESTTSPDSTLPPKLLRAYRMTGGYVDYLRANVTNKLRSLKIDRDHVTDRTRAMADWTAHMRSAPPEMQYGREPDYSAIKELPSRLQAQFVRLALCLTVVYGKSEVDDEVLDLVRRVAVDTGRGRSQTICEYLAKAGRGGIVPATLAVWMKEDESKVLRWLLHMEKVQAVEWYSPESGGVMQLRRWRLTNKLQQLYREVFDAKVSQ